MKYLPSVLKYLLQTESVKRNLRQLLKFLVVLVCLEILYSILFHFLMAYDPMALFLIKKLKNHHDYVVILEDHRQALELYDMGFRGP